MRAPWRREFGEARSRAAMQRAPGGASAQQQQQRSPFAIQELLGLGESDPRHSVGILGNHGPHHRGMGSLAGVVPPPPLPPPCGFPGGERGMYLGHAFVPCGPFLHGFENPAGARPETHATGEASGLPRSPRLVHAVANREACFLFACRATRAQT